MITPVSLGKFYTANRYNNISFQKNKKEPEKQEIEIIIVDPWYKAAQAQLSNLRYYPPNDYDPDAPSVTRTHESLYENNPKDPSNYGGVIRN